MSNESAPEIFSHKDNRHYQTRLDYMLLYRSEGKAKIIRTLETWTNTKYAEWYKAKADSREQKKEPPEEDLWVTMSYDEFSLFIYGTIQFETVKKQVDELVAQGHLKRRPHPEFPYGPPQYLLNRAVIQKALDELEIPPDLFDLVPVFIRPRKKHTPPETYPHPGGILTPRGRGKIPPPTGEISPPSNNLSKNLLESTKNQGTYSGISEPAADGSAIASPVPALSSQDSYSQPHAQATLGGNNDTETSDPTREPTARPDPARNQPERTVPGDAGRTGVVTHGLDTGAARDSGHSAPADALSHASDKTAQAQESSIQARQATTAAVAQDAPAGEAGYRQGERPEKPEQATSGTEKPARTRRKAVKPAPEFTAEGRKVYDAWCSLFKSPPRAAGKTMDCADALYSRLLPWCLELHVSCAALLDEIQKHLYKTDTSGFYKRGVTLCDIDRDFEKWQGAKTQAQALHAQKTAPKPSVSADNHCLVSDEEMREQSDILWAEMQAKLATPEVQAILAAKGISHEYLPQ